MVKFVEVFESNNNNYNMREVVINPSHVIALREDDTAKRALNESRMPKGISPETSFTKVYLNSGNFNLMMTVASPISIVEQKLAGTKKILKG